MSEFIDAMVGAAVEKVKKSLDPDVYGHVRHAIILTLFFIFLHYLPLSSSITFVIKAVAFFLVAVIVLYFF